MLSNSAHLSSGDYQLPISTGGMDQSIPMSIGYSSAPTSFSTGYTPQNPPASSYMPTYHPSGTMSLGGMNPSGMSSTFNTYHPSQGMGASFGTSMQPPSAMNSPYGGMSSLGMTPPGGALSPLGGRPPVGPPGVPSSANAAVMRRTDHKAYRRSYTHAKGFFKNHWI